MKLINYLKEQLPKDWVLTEELNINWDGETTIGILKMQTGTKYQDSVVQPFQLIVMTDNVIDAKAELESFITKNQNQFFISDFINYCKQYYYKPVIPTVATPTGNMLTSQIILTGTLIVSQNVSDIKAAYIDGELIKITTSAINFSSQGEGHVYPLRNTTALAETKQKASAVSFQITFINKNNSFGEKLRLLRQGKLSINTLFDLKLVFTDNDSEEEYKCVISSYAINSENGTLPVATVVFTKGA